MNDANDTANKKAVAVKKTDNSQDATIVAKGNGHHANRILDIAFSKGEKVRSDKELVDLLEQLGIDSPIPLEALSAVSEIIDYVYKANQSMLIKSTREGMLDTNSEVSNKGKT